MKNNIVTGLDIGTHTIKVLVLQKAGKEWEVLSFVKKPSFGLRKGAVVNPEEVTKNIQIALAEVQKECGERPNSVFVNISGSHLYVTPSDGIISVSRADQRISQEDIDRVLQATRAINIPSNQEVLDVFAREYIIDDQKGIKQPLGLTGVRLEAKVLLLCVFSPYFMNLTQAVLGAKLQIDDIIPSPLAAADAVLTPQQKELGVAVIDFGSATTSLAVYEEGDLLHFAVFPIGSCNITNDIAVGLKTEIDVAENIKKEHGSCMMPKTDTAKDTSKKKIEITEKGAALDFTKKNLIDIIEPRVCEIVDLIQKELKKIGRQELLPGGVILTGGGAKLPKLKEYVKEKLKLPCNIASPKGILGMDDDPSLATVAGLVFGGVDFEEEPGILVSVKGISSKLKKILRAFIP